MMKKHRSIAWLVIFISLCLLFSVEANLAQQVIQEEKSAMAQEEENQDQIIPGPQGIKESIGIYVFVVWMWLAIFVLVYILMLKIREVDRLFEIRYLSEKKK